MQECQVLQSLGVLQGLDLRYLFFWLIQTFENPGLKLRARRIWYSGSSFSNIKNLYPRKGWWFGPNSRLWRYYAVVFSDLLIFCDGARWLCWYSAGNFDIFCNAEHLAEYLQGWWFGPNRRPSGNLRFKFKRVTRNIIGPLFKNDFRYKHLLMCVLKSKAGCHKI